MSERKGNIVSTSRELQQLFISIQQGKQTLLDFVVSRALSRYPVPGSKIVMKSRSVKRCKKKCEKRAGAGERQGGGSHLIFLAATAPFPKTCASGIFALLVLVRPHYTI